MQYRFTLAALAAAMPLAHAYGVTVNNKCGSSAFVWSVGDQPGPMNTLDSASPSWSQAFFSKSGGGGPSIKIKDNDNLWDGGAETQLEYKWDGTTLWYDLSYINGIAFSGKNIQMSTSNSACPSVTCSAADPSCGGGAYLHPNDVDTLSCPGGADLVLTLCAGGSGSSSPNPAPQAPAPPKAAPTTTSVAPPPPTTTSTPPAPTKPAQAPQAAGGDFLENGPNQPVQMATVVATEVVVITSVKHVPAATPVVDSDGSVHEKREAHLHQHKGRGHSRVFGRHQH